jgi:hypothetical protein
LKAERKERLDASGNEGLEETNMVTLEQDIVKVVFFFNSAEFSRERESCVYGFWLVYSKMFFGFVMMSYLVILMVFFF